MTSVAELRKRYHAKDVELSRREGEKAQLIRALEEEQYKQAEYEKQRMLTEKAGLFLMNELTERRKSAIETIEKIATSALQMIVGPDHRFFFETFEEKRMQGQKNFKMAMRMGSPFLNDDGTPDELVTGLMGELGGGLQEIMAFAFLFAVLEWIGYTGPIILDEAFHFMSNDGKLDLVGIFVREYSDKTGRQIIFITHKGEFEQIADKVFRVNLVKGNSIVSTLKAGTFLGASIEG